MADIKFDCPKCGLSIACDELWTGQEVQCPGCQAGVIVPAQAAPSAGTAPLTPKVPPSGQSRLSLSAAAGAHPAAGGATQQRQIPIRNLAPPPQKRKSPLVKILTIAGVVIVLVVAGVIAWPYLAPLKDKLTGKSETPPTNATAAAQAPAPAEAPAVPSAASLPVLPPKYTLDLAEAKIPESRVNGTISGTNFVAETARVDQAGPASVLRFLEGQPTAPEREILVYLRLKAGESVSGQKVSVTSDMRTGAPQVMKRWKTSPRYAPSAKTYSSGYAMQLELGQLTNGVLPGKIFLALPDKEETVIAGRFDATSSLPEGGALNPAAAAQPQAVPTAGNMSDAERSAFQRRYGVAPK